MLQIERNSILKGQSPQQVLDIVAAESSVPRENLIEMIRRFYRLWSRNQWKRERTAPAFHLDEFNVDPKTWYRHPILSSGYEKELAELK